MSYEKELENRIEELTEKLSITEEKNIELTNILDVTRKTANILSTNHGDVHGILMNTLDRCLRLSNDNYTHVVENIDLRSKIGKLQEQLLEYKIKKIHDQNNNVNVIILCVLSFILSVFVLCLTLF